MSFKLYNIKLNSINKKILPSGIYIWNNFNTDTKYIEIYSVFNKAIHLSINIPYKQFLEFGTRPNQIVHCILHLECNNLNGHRFKRHINDSLLCSCGYPFENTFLVYLPVVS